MKRLIEGIAIAAVILLGLFLRLNTSFYIDDTLWAILVLVGVFAVFVAVETYYEKLQKREKDHIIINEKDKTAELFKRSDVSASYLSFAEHDISYTKYNPSQLVYTGATVGGIHTGGFHTTKAHYSSHSQGRAGKYYIYSKDHNGKVVIIQKIILTEELLEEASKSATIKKFIVGNCLELKYDTPETKLTAAEYDILRNATMSYDHATQLNITQRAFLASQLTRADCVAILNWVSGL